MALLIAALTCGAFAATASAHRSDDGSGTETGKRVALVGKVATVDPAARTLTVTVKNKGKHHGWHRHHGLARTAHRGEKRPVSKTYTVNAGELTLPAVGDKVLVKGTLLADGTVDATAIRVLDAARDDASRDDDDAKGDDHANRGRGDKGDNGRRGHHDDDDDRRGRDDA